MGQRNTNAVPCDDRRSPRLYVQFPATLAAVPAGPVEIAVVNVSCHGVMIETSAHFVPGRPVSLTTEGLGAVAGEVAWVRDGHAGIAFARALTPDELDRLA